MFLLGPREGGDVFQLAQTHFEGDVLVEQGKQDAGRDEGEFEASLDVAFVIVEALGKLVNGTDGAVDEPPLPLAGRLDGHKDGDGFGGNDDFLALEGEGGLRGGLDEMEGKRLYHLFGTLFARECLPVENEGDALRGDFNATHEQFHQAVPFAEREFLHQNSVHDSALDGLEVGVLAFARHLGHEFGLLQLGMQEGTNLPLQEVGGQTAYLATVALKVARTRAVADVVTVGALAALMEAVVHGASAGGAEEFASQQGDNVRLA